MIEKSENLWGYGKRLRVILDSASTEFPDRGPGDIRVLDVGCGNGSELGIDLARVGFDYTGIDLHEPSIRAAQEKALGLENAQFRCIAVEELKNEPFDVVILSEVLEHLERPDVLLRDSIAHLKPGGIVVVTVPNGYGEFEWDLMVYRRLGLEALASKINRNKATGSTENHDDGHVQFFSLASIGELFTNAGLEVIDQRSTSFASGPFVKQTLGRSTRFVEWNARIADRLPMKFNSGWIFVLRRSAG